MLREPIGIRAFATYVPEGRRSAAEIAAATGGRWSEQAVRDKLGIEQIAVPGPDDGVREMGAKAAERCLARAGVYAEDVDAILCIGDELREYPMTTSGIWIQERIGARRAWALNPRVSFMYNLAPGGGAALIERGHARHEILGVSLISDGALARHVLARQGGTESPVTAENAQDARRCLDVIHQEGMRRLLAERSHPNFMRVIRESLAEGGLTTADIDYLAVLHMKRSGHLALLQDLGLREEQSTYLACYGHLGQFDQLLSLELAEAHGRLRDGAIISAVGAGIGYSWGAVALRWGGAV